MVENRTKHCPGGGHAVVAHGMGVKLQRQPDIAMAKESLHSFGIGLDADEERRKAVPQIMKPESPGSSSTNLPSSWGCDNRMPALTAAGRR
jgi:hypothetical protein